jgi:hypothetical protein
LQAYGYTEDTLSFSSFDGGKYLDEKYLLDILERKQGIATFNVLRTYALTK